MASYVASSPLIGAVPAVARRAAAADASGNSYLLRVVHSANTLRLRFAPLVSLALAASVAFVGPGAGPYSTLFAGASSDLTASVTEVNASAAAAPVEPPGLDPGAHRPEGGASAVSRADLPYHGFYSARDDAGVLRMATTDGHFDLVHPPPATHVALLEDSNRSAQKLAAASRLPVFNATVDTGCTASATERCDRLVNVRPWSEVFAAANGHLAKTTGIGDLPVLARASDGSLLSFSFTNVRCVTSFKSTLLSERQMWKEQGIRARFADDRCLELPASPTGREKKGPRLPYLADARTHSIELVSSALLPDGCKARAACGLADRAVRAGGGRPSGPPQKANSSAGGFHDVRSSAHIGNLSAAQASEVMHRRLHISAARVRALHHCTRDAPKVLERAPNVTCVHCAEARMKKASHSGTLDAPAPEPGDLHWDLLGPWPLSMGNYVHAMFFVDNHTRFIWVEFLKSKAPAELVRSCKRVIAKFNSTVGVPVDETGKPAPRPVVRTLRRDHEGGAESAAFAEFLEGERVHSPAAPPGDHDFNGIVERTLSVVEEIATAMKKQSNAPVAFWPWIIRHAINVRNNVLSAVGSSTADATQTASHRFTLRLSQCMKLGPFGCRAIVPIPDALRRKHQFQGRGWAGSYLGESDTSVGASDVWVCDRSGAGARGVALEPDLGLVAPLGRRVEDLLVHELLRLVVLPLLGRDGALRGLVLALELAEVVQVERPRVALGEEGPVLAHDVRLLHVVGLVLHLAPHLEELEAGVAAVEVHGLALVRVLDGGEQQDRQLVVGRLDVERVEEVALARDVVRVERGLHGGRVRERGHCAAGQLGGGELGLLPGGAAFDAARLARRHGVVLGGAGHDAQQERNGLIVSEEDLAGDLHNALREQKAMVVGVPQCLAHFVYVSGHVRLDSAVHYRLFVGLALTDLGEVVALIGSTGATLLGLITPAASCVPRSRSGFDRGLFSWSESLGEVDF